jgi:hypothetical protein
MPADTVGSTVPPAGDDGAAGGAGTVEANAWPADQHTTASTSTGVVRWTSPSDMTSSSTNSFTTERVAES